MHTAPFRQVKLPPVPLTRQGTLSTLGSKLSPALPIVGQVTSHLCPKSFSGGPSHSRGGASVLKWPRRPSTVCPPTPTSDLLSCSLSLGPGHTHADHAGPAGHYSQHTAGTTPLSGMLPASMPTAHGVTLNVTFSGAFLTLFKAADLVPTPQDRTGPASGCHPHPSTETGPFTSSSPMRGYVPQKEGLPCSAEPPGIGKTPTI